MALHFVRRKRIRVPVDVTSLISATICIERAINSRRNLLFLSFSLRTRKLKRGNSVNGIEASARCIAVLPPSPFSLPSSLLPLLVLVVSCACLLVRCIYAHTRVVRRPNTIGRRARARTCHPF